LTGEGDAVRGEQHRRAEQQRADAGDAPAEPTLARREVQEEAAGLGQDADQEQEAGDPQGGVRQGRPAQDLQHGQGEDEQDAGVGVAGAEHGPLVFGEGLLAHDAHQRVAAVHHGRQRQQRDHREQLDRSVHFKLLESGVRLP